MVSKDYTPIAIIRHYGDPQKAKTLAGVDVERMSTLFAPGDGFNKFYPTTP